MRIVGSMFIVIAVALMGLIPLTEATAQEAKGTMLGKWGGTTLFNDLPQPVFINVTKLSPGDKGMLLTYTAPQDCTLSGIYGGKTSKGHVFYLRAHILAGGCHWLKDDTDHVILSMGDNGEMSYAMNIGKSRHDGGTVVHR